jgi:hypothetical protein
MLEYAIAAAVAAGIVAVGLTVTRRKPPPTLRDQVGALATRVNPAAIEGAMEWLPPEEYAAGRRRTQRRSGPPTPVRISPVPVGDLLLAEEGMVVDRSSGGICVATRNEYEVGGRVYVRAEAAPPESLWVGVTVRYCRKDGELFLIGCEYCETLPWGVLLLFG